jgi:hypothetical protein
MSTDALTFDQQNLRGTDSNSLLRMYDQAKVFVKNSPSQQERARADKAIERIAKELKKRNVTL